MIIYPHGDCRESSYATRPSLTSTKTRTGTTICSGIGMRREHLIRSSHYNSGVTITIAILSFDTSHSDHMASHHVIKQGMAVEHVRSFADHPDRNTDMLPAYPRNSSKWTSHTF